MDKPWSTGITSVMPNELRVRGYRLDELMGTASYGTVLYLILKGELPTPGQGKLMDAMLVASIDHGVTPPSALACRTAASTGAPINGALASGALAINRHHGGAIEGCMEVLVAGVQRMQKEEVDAPTMAASIISDAKAAKRRIPGFGHRIHTADPRTARLIALAKEAKVYGSHLALAEAMVAVLSAKRPLPLNVDGCMAACLAELGFAPALANAFFIMSRMGGLTAHFIEERTRERPMRRIGPNWEYDGHDARNLPEDWQ